MKVYNHLDEYRSINNPVVTIGIFDGVHLGHQKILNKLIEAANEMDGQALLLSFFPHPRVVLNPDAGDLRLINTLDEKISLLDKLGLENIIIHPFDIDFSNITSEEFIEKILIDRLQVKKVVIGYDHHFGKNRTGGFEQLLKFAESHNFVVEEIPAQDIKDIHISSTKIRNALFDGLVEVANTYLGYSYFMRGTVIEGDKIGRSILFPTANIYIEEKYKLIPKNGVYAVKVKVLGKEFNGMLNIGNRPTVPGRDFSIEVHIFDFNDDIYGQTIEVALIKRIRDEIKFEDLSALQKQLNHDQETAKKLLI